MNKLDGSRGIAGRKRNANIVLMRKPEGKIPLGRPGCEWKNSIKTDLHKTGLESVDLMNMGRGKSGGLF